MINRELKAFAGRVERKGDGTENDWGEFFSVDEEVDTDLEGGREFQNDAQALELLGEYDEGNMDCVELMERLNIDVRERAFGKHLTIGG